MHKNNIFVLACIFLFFYLLNFLVPMSFGDDYLYAFLWQGKPMFVPLAEDAIRISSIHDLFVSQVSFYLTWSGRVVNNTLAQISVWAGKDVFNVCNSLVSLLLVMEIYWCTNKGKVSINFKIGLLCWIFFMFWTFTPGFPSSVLWLVGACHYLWPAVLLVGFMLPYIRKYYNYHVNLFNKRWFNYFIFIFGIIAGCTNENSICWIILVLSVFIYNTKEKLKVELWLYFGLAGLILGYVVLMFAPGNMVRLLSVHGYNWFNMDKLLKNLNSFWQVLIWQFILWYFCLCSLYKLRYEVKNSLDSSLKGDLQREVLFVKILCITAIGMSAIMLFSPEFHLRSAFPGTIQLIIATGVLIRIQKEYNIKLLQQNVQKFLICLGVTFFIVSATVTIRHLYDHNVYNEKLLACVKIFQQRQNCEEEIICIKIFPKTRKSIDCLSGFHTYQNNLRDNENSWENVAYARYFGIKGIRALEQDIVP